MSTVDCADVAIITRTKNRPVTLRRACESIVSQTYRNFVWVVVNDGGDPQPVEEIVASARNCGVDVIAIHNSHSVGMEAASNIGIRRSKSKYIVLLDDDDTWDESFLFETVTFLDQQNWCSGVATQTVRAFEKIDQSKVTVSFFMPLNPNLDEVFIMDIVGRHPFTINAFLFRREAFDEIGGFSEDLPLGGDYEFHLKFIEKYDIGVLPKPLAFYHLRESSDEYANSAPTISNVDIRELHKNIVRDRLLRRDLREGKLGVGALSLLGAHYRRVNQSLEFDWRVIGQLLEEPSPKT